MRITSVTALISDFEAYHIYLKGHCSSKLTGDLVLDFIFVVCNIMKVASQESRLKWKFRVSSTCLKYVDLGAYLAHPLTKRRKL